MSERTRVCSRGETLALLEAMGGHYKLHNTRHTKVKGKIRLSILTNPNRKHKPVTEIIIFALIINIWNTSVQ